MNDSLLDKGQIVVVNDDPAKMNELVKRLKDRGLACVYPDPGDLAAVRIGFDYKSRKEANLIFTLKPLDTTRDRGGSCPIAAVVAASAVDDAWLDAKLPETKPNAGWKPGRGDYARLPDGKIVRVLGPCPACDRDQTHVYKLLDGTLPEPSISRNPRERFANVNELAPWTPRPGEFVVAMVDQPWNIACKIGALLLVGPDANHAKTADGGNWHIAPDDNPEYLRPTSEPGFARPKVTLAWLEREGACVAGREWFIDAFGKNAEVACETVVDALRDRPDWLEWLDARA